MTEHDQPPVGPDQPAAGEGDTTPDHDPFYCIRHPETGEWLIVMKRLPRSVRAAIFDKTDGPEVSEEWMELRQPNWAINILHMQAEEGSEGARTTLADSVLALPMPEGWNEFVLENFDPNAPDMAPSYSDYETPEQ